MFQDIKLVAERNILNIIIFKYYWSANLASKLLSIDFQFTVYVSMCLLCPVNTNKTWIIKQSLMKPGFIKCGLWSSRSHRTTRADNNARQKLTKAHLFRRRKPASFLVWHFPFRRIRLCSSYRRLSQCEFASWSCRRLCLHSLQLEDVPQFLAIWAFCLCVILTGAGYSRHPTF